MRMEISVGAFAFATLLIAAFMFLQLAHAQSAPQGNLSQ